MTMYHDEIIFVIAYLVSLQLDFAMNDAIPEITTIHSRKCQTRLWQRACCGLLYMR